MPFIRPTLIEIQDRQIADFQSHLGLTSLTKNSFIGALIKSLAGAIHLLYGFMQYISKQALPDTAEADYLNRWAAIWGVSRALPTFSAGNVTFTGTNGTDIPAGTLLQYADGIQYTTDSLATISSGTATAAVTATLAGADNNLAVGLTLSLINPIAGINSTVTIASGGLTGGVDAEDDESLREEMLSRIQNPPQGGAKNDYIRWALEVEGVSSAYVFTDPDDLGIVNVAILGPNREIPDSGVVDAVQEYIDDDSRRPVTAFVTVYAPVEVALNLTISITPDSDEVRSIVEDSIQALLARDGTPGSTIYLSRIREAVSIAAGESDSAVTVPSTDVTYTNGQIPVLGTITWA